MWSTITKNLLNWRAEFNQLITRVCICELCLEPADHSGFLCTPCRCELPRNLTACSQCAEPLTIAGRCGRCQKTPPAFDYTLSPFLYEGVTALWTRKAKDRRKTKAMKQLNWLIAEHAPPLPQSADGLVAVPSSRLRMLIRGFNPAQELAGSLGKRQGLPVLETGIKRASAIDQRALNAHQRRSNQKQAFIRSDQRFDGKHLIIVDDVMTTGATADAFATQLKQQGAHIVGVCTLLRTPQR